MTLVISRLQSPQGVVEVVVRKVISSQVVEEGYPLARRVEADRWRVLGDRDEKLIRKSCLVTLYIESVLEASSCGGYIVPGTEV